MGRAVTGYPIPSGNRITTQNRCRPLLSDRERSRLDSFLQILPATPRHHQSTLPQPLPVLSHAKRCGRSYLLARPGRGSSCYDYTTKRVGWQQAPRDLSLPLWLAEAAHLRWDPEFVARTRQGGQDSDSRRSNGPLGSSLAQRCRAQRCALAGVQLVRPLSLRPTTPAGEHVERSQQNAGYILCKGGRA
jgi:hypothetical protein